ncbi:NAD(P)-dependent oxidoreductase [Herbiconiux ginsengi]|uniref:3-hydroxyisobutyrate dehydrogenase n=1 Tax=Herbiconiux ginsengi TaxID=381665 RepID=A0A1H3QQJ8_9MICO|nr:NAD(P)-dependent oxidoreductase [Herbiconiux ginsengi]SDZ14989.1 3-hydroxyisobutyrate dehydrogenase [Herbiconiux ginsengi]
MPAVAFVGLGTMGSATVSRLIETGHEVHVWNRSPEPVERMRALGAIPLGSVAEAFRIGTVFSMVADDAAAESLFTDDVLSAAPEGAAHVNLASLSVAATRRLASAHRMRGIDYLAVPVLGRAEVAAAGALNLVAAGPEQALKRVEPVLQSIGKRTWYLGDDVAAASVVKIGVNFNLIHTLQALAESVTLVEAAGIDPSVFVDILTDTAYTGTAYTGYGRLIAERRYSPPGFTVGLGLKDLSLVESAAADYDVVLPTVPTLRTMFEAAIGAELGDADWSAIAEVTRGLAAQHSER